MRKNKILSVIGGLAAFIFTSCDGIFDVDYYTFLSEDYIFTNNHKDIYKMKTSSK